jgi:uncharacterized protein (TIGR00162 family)
MSTRILELKKPRLKNPVFIEGLPGVGNVGRIAGGYLVEELKAVKFAELYSSNFMPFVLLQKGSTVHVLKNEFYYWKPKRRKPGQRDLIILIGDSQSIVPEGHYEIVEQILDYVKKFGVKEMFTLAGLGIGEKKDKPEVIGAVNAPELIKKYKKYDIKFATGDKVGTIAGASGLLLGLGANVGIKGVCLLGETSGVPLIPDPKSAEAVLNTLAKILKIKIDTSKIQKKVKDMEDFIKRVEKMQRQALMHMMKERMGKTVGKGKEADKEEEEELSYIG